MSGVPEGPIIREVEAEDYFSVTEKGIKDGSFREAAENGFRVLQSFCRTNNLLGKHVKAIGVSPDDPIKVDPSECKYISCLQFDSDDMKILEPKDKVVRYRTEKGLYAVFTLKGPHENIQKAYEWIVDIYLPHATYAYRTGSAPYECYLNDPENTSAELLETEIYIPVLKKPKKKADRKEGKETGNEESKEDFFEETKEALVEETWEAVVEETKEAVIEETKEAVIEETKEAVVEETKEAIREEIKGAVNEEIKDTVDEKAVIEETKEAIREEIKEEAIVEEKKQ